MSAMTQTLTLGVMSNANAKLTDDGYCILTR